MKTSPEHLHIPKEIKRDIEEKWFHLYRWISPEEVKLSIEKDFLHTMKIIWAPLAIVSILGALPFYEDIGKLMRVFLLIICVWIFFLFFYLLFLSFRRSSLLSKSAFVVLTDSSISLGGKVRKLSEISSLWKEIDEVSETFSEWLFEDSRLGKEKAELKKELLHQIYGWYKLFFSKNEDSRINWGKDKNTGQAILLIILLYTLYIGVMSVVYFIGIFFLLIFGNTITWCNTRYLLWKGNTVLKINTLFGNVDRDAEELSLQTHALKKSLKSASKNEWKDGLLLEIRAWIEALGTLSNTTTDNAVLLRDTIAHSKYYEMFHSWTYNTWIKKQVISPLQEIEKLLQKSKESLTMGINTISDEISSPLKSEFSGNLEMQKKRLLMQIDDIDIFLPRIQEMIEKLK
jgi:hypothetical protein